MKHTYRIILTLFVPAILTACGNFEIDHDDYLYTSGYLPYQYPVRTLVLGDYIYDNSNDNAHKFLISVAMGGVYKNEKNREFKIVVDESLCNNLLFTSGGDPVRPLPSNYYTLSSQDKIVIPAGKMNGGIEVQLNDAFFNDPLTIRQSYVVPVRIVGSSDVDTVLLSKNFTLFAVKYINEYHGSYFHYGTSSVKNATGATVENTAYNTEKYVESNPVVKLVTTARYQVKVSLNFESEIIKGAFDLILTFNGDNCIVSAPEGASYTVAGSGEFKSKSYEWGNKERDGIALDYTVTNDKGSYAANDVLVARDRGVVMEVFTPVAND
ncbi:MAG: DUF5627 domain-containing protein [Tannerella sp.]|jgi:hypothetical protein|nr:DUF5627 domain-containing protein [Tannerella sp.]